MSLVVLGIAAAHALPPIVGGVISKGKVGVIVGSIIGGAIAIASGNPVFIVADLIGVAAGTWLGFNIVK